MLPADMNPDIITCIRSLNNSSSRKKHGSVKAFQSRVNVCSSPSGPLGPLRIKRPQVRILLGAPQTADKLRAVGGCFLCPQPFSFSNYYSLFQASHITKSCKFLLLLEIHCRIFCYNSSSYYRCFLSFSGFCQLKCQFSFQITTV